MERLHFLAFLPGLQVHVQGSERGVYCCPGSSRLLADLLEHQSPHALDLPLLPFVPTSHKHTALSNMHWDLYPRVPVAPGVRKPAREQIWTLVTLSCSWSSA